MNHFLLLYVKHHLKSSFLFCVVRFAFFTRIEESDLSAFESLIKSNKKAILSVASVLRMELEDAEDGILDVIIDRDQGL